MSASGAKMPVTMTLTLMKLMTTEIDLMTLGGAPVAFSRSAVDGLLAVPVALSGKAKQPLLLLLPPPPVVVVNLH